MGTAGGQIHVGVGRIHSDSGQICALRAFLVMASSSSAGTWWQRSPPGIAVASSSRRLDAGPGYSSSVAGRLPLLQEGSQVPLPSGFSSVASCGMRVLQARLQRPPTVRCGWPARSLRRCFSGVVVAWPAVACSGACQRHCGGVLTVAKRRWVILAAP